MLKSCRVNVLVSKAPMYWNPLPVQVKLAPSLGIFKTRLKKHLCG